MADSLQSTLGKNFEVSYPKLLTDEQAPDFGWLQQIGETIAAIRGEIILVGHSLGASMLLKYLSENEVNKTITGLFFIATPFWSGDEDWVKGLQLPEDFSEKLPKTVPLFFYQSRDDEEVPFDQFERYKQKLPWATFREIKQGGHQFNNDLSLVATDIASL